CPSAETVDVDLSNSHFASSFMWRAVAKAPPHVEKTTEGKNDPGRDTRSLMPPVKRAARETSISGLAVLRLRVADARILRWARECVALLARNLVFHPALPYGRVLACVRLLRRRILARIGHDAVDLGVGLGLDQRGVCFLHADVLGIARKLVTFLIGDVVGRFATSNARILARLRRVVVGDFRVGLGNLFLTGGFRETNVLGVAATR